MSLILLIINTFQRSMKSGEMQFMLSKEPTRKNYCIALGHAVCNEMQI